MDALTKFTQAHGYIEFPFKKLAIEFLLALPDETEAQLFAKDKPNSDTPGAQTFIISHANKPSSVLFEAIQVTGDSLNFIK